MDTGLSMPTEDDWTALLLTMRLAAVTTVILLLVGTPLALGPAGVTSFWSRRW